MIKALSFDTLFRINLEYSGGKPAVTASIFRSKGKDVILLFPMVVLTVVFVNN